MTNRRILIVEDEAIVAKDIENGLKELGYAVLAVASSAEQAIQQTAALRPDLILMDIRLRGVMDGIQAAEQIHAHFDIPVVYLTAYADADTLQRAKITQPFGYVVKPFELEELHGAIEMALYKHGTEKELHERERFLTLLNDVTRAALETPDLPTMLQTLAGRLGELFGADGCYLTLWDEATQTTMPATASGTMREIYPSLGPEPGELTMTASVLQTGRPLAIKEVSNTPYCSRRIAGLFPTHSLLGLPLVAGDRKLGAVFIAFNASHEFTPQEVAQGEQVAEQIALAIAKVQLLEDARQRIAELQALQRTSLQLTSSLDLPAVLDGIAESALSLVGATNCHIYLYDETDGTFTTGIALWQDGRREAAVRTPRQAGLTATVAREAQVLVINDAAHHPLYTSPRAQRWGVQAVAGFPLLRAGRVLGVFTITFLQAHTFNENELRVLGLLADQAAIAIENARLVEGLEAEVDIRMDEIVAEQQKSAAVLRSVGDAIALTDLELRVQYINEAFTTMTGYAPAEALGRRVSVIIGEKMSQTDRQSLRSALAAGESWRGEATIRRKDGRTRETEMSLAPVRDAQGSLVGFVSSYRDISHLKELNRARGQFMTNVSHELRTPVTNLKLYLHMLRSGDTTQKAEHYLQVLHGQIDRLDQLVQDILEMAALDSGQAATDWGSLSLSTIIQDAITRYQSRAKAAALTLVARSVPSTLPAVEGDQALLARALNELLENAIIFTPAGGQVTIETGTFAEQDRCWVTVAVHDTGPGIPHEEQKRIFERFFRGRLAESGHIPGSGLGLSIAQEIMRVHGGRVTLDSHTGQGSSLTLWLRSGETEWASALSSPTTLEVAHLER
jgi:PAS domain S-box-containing protein